MTGLLIFLGAAIGILGGALLIAVRTARPERLAIVDATPLEAEALNWERRLRAGGIRCQVREVPEPIDGFEFTSYTYQIWVRPQEVLRARRVLRLPTHPGSDRTR